MIRFIVSAPLALFLALLLFYGLALTTKMGEQQQRVVEVNPVLNFEMLRDESDVRARLRQLPKPQEVQQEPEPQIPQTPVASALQIDAPSLNVEVPDISMSLDVSLAPSLINIQIQEVDPGFVSNPKILSRVPPRYPVRALQRRLEGRVLVEFTIDQTGAVVSDSVRVIESDPKGVFDSAVLRSIKNWQFEIRIEDGQAMAYRARQELKFQLEK